MSEQTTEDIIEKINGWADGSRPPTTKEEEDNFLDIASELIGKNCKKNPGSLGEWIVLDKLRSIYPDECFKTNQKNECDWLGPQKYSLPDITSKGMVGEVKTLRYFNTHGKRGGQGTGPEKLDSIFRKYSNIGGKKVIYLVADQQFEKNGKQFLDAFNEGNYSNNNQLEFTVPQYKKWGFSVVSFNSL